MQHPCLLRKVPAGKFCCRLIVVDDQLNDCLVQVNCEGSDAFGRRRRQAPVVDSIPSAVSANLSAVQIRESIIDGQLREEIMVQSNSILALDHGGEERFSAPTEGKFVILIEFNQHLLLQLFPYF